MKTEQIELLERYLDGTAGAADLERFLELLREDPAFRAEAVDALRTGGLLHAGMGPDATADRLSELVSIAIPAGDRPLETSVLEKIEERGLKPARRPWSWAKAAALLAAGWALALVGWLLLREPPTARLVAAGPGATVERDGGRSPGAADFALRLGDTVEVPAGGWAWIAYADGTSLQLGAGTSLTLEGKGLPPDQKRVRVDRGAVAAEVAPQARDRAMIFVSPQAEARVLGTALTLDVGGESTRLRVRSGRVAFAKGGASVEVVGGQSAVAGRGLVVESTAREVLRRLGKNRFMLGIMSGWGESWVADTQAQDCRWDLRYQHLTREWTSWNPNGAFVSMYIEESVRLGIVPVFTYYGLVGTKPEDPAAMRAYFDGLRLFMERAGASTKPVVLHVEPNRLIPRVAVKSSGVPEFAGLADTAASFAAAFGVLRDRLAPNVLLAGHATPADGLIDGPWDLLFTDMGNRDVGFSGAPLWTEGDFEAFRAWGASTHARTGLPIFVWRIPLGNTHMAACNNTPWHYMDNRVEHWLEGYPANPRIAAWASAGFAGLLFGGGATGCTVHKDNAKDGVSNPPPAPGNKGERSEFPDDDGGYLRLRAGAYYRSGPAPLWKD